MQKICLLCTSKGQFRNEWWEEHGHRLLTRLGEVSKILKTSIEEGYYNRLGQDCHLGILFPYRAPSHQTPQWQFLSDMRQKNGCEYRILTPPFVDIAQIFPICPLMYHCLLSCSPFTHISPHPLSSFLIRFPLVEMTSNKPPPDKLLIQPSYQGLHIKFPQGGIPESLTFLVQAGILPLGSHNTPTASVRPINFSYHLILLSHELLEIPMHLSTERPSYRCI